MKSDGSGQVDLRCATWNVHRCRGADGRVRPDRVLEAIVTTPDLAEADILTLNEAEAEGAPGAAFPALAGLPAATGLVAVRAGPDPRSRVDAQGFRGTLLFVRPPLTVADVALIDLAGLCPRGAVVADVLGGSRPFRVVATHLSLSQPLRILQMRSIGRHLSRRVPHPAVLMGDLNEWRPWGGLALAHAVAGFRFGGQTRATFPAFRPILPLDRILCDIEGAVTGVRVLDTSALRAASDHLPLAARVRF